MKKTSVLTALLIFILILLTTLLLALTTSDLSFSSHSNIFSYTKAICNSTNFCQDYEIHCKSEKMIKMSPITGAVVQFSENWIDPRDEEIRNNIC